MLEQKLKAQAFRRKKMPNNNNDPWQSMAVTLNQNGYPSGTGGNYRGSPFSEGDRVVLVGGFGSADPGPEANPIWGYNSEYIAGTINGFSGSQMLVNWDNGFRNLYYLNNQTSQIELLVNVQGAPKKKKLFTTGKLDTTQLDSLVIDPEVKTEIVALLQQHKHANKIFDDWGLGEVIEYGRGMTLMFYGGPGTGKTYGARCIAKALGKELLVIGSAEIQTSEPGGANRAIQQAFATAKSEKKVLFIDECDSLISNRANLGMILASEINTLLTEIEKSEEVVILATNRIGDMDSALERRLSLIIEFTDPNKEQRAQIWKGLLPSKMPLEADVTIEALSEHELTGGLIKNVVLQAARLAVADGSKEVGMKHFTKAIDRTVSSQGLMGQDRVQTRDDMGVGMGTDIHRKIELDIDRDKLSSFLDSE